MKTIIHDLEEKEFKKIKFNSEDKVIAAKKCKNHCIGCFNCWTKHPTVCAIQDEYSNIVESLEKSDELVLISKNRYGCIDSNVKRVIERCIGYILPFFTERNGLMHHEKRFNKPITLSIYTYNNKNSEDYTCLEKLTKAIAINLGANKYKTIMSKNLKEINNVYFN